MRMNRRLLQPIMKKVLFIVPLYLFTFLPLHSQTFTQRIQKTAAGEGTVTIHQDQAIDDLVNAPIATKKPKPNGNKPRTTTNTPSPTPSTQHTAPSAQRSTSNDTTQVEADSLDATPKHVFKTIGYRVQVLAGGNTRQDRQRAEQAGRSLRILFPGEEVYVHFYSPRWICRLGNYRTYEEAHEKMLEVRKLGYNSATIVKGKITVTE